MTICKDVLAGRVMGVYSDVFVAQRFLLAQ